MNYHELPEWAGWLASIRGQPDDDRRRLFCADWLDELETEEAAGRAAWVRHHLGGYTLPPVFLDSSPSLEWLPAIPGYVRSELPNAVEYTPNRLHADADVVRAEFSRGFVSRVSAPLSVLNGERCRCMEYTRLTGPCDCCGGTGRTPGVLGELLRREPITAAGVVVTDKAPGETPSGWAWWRWTGLDDTDTLPEDVFDAIPNDVDAVFSVQGERMCFATPAAASLALGEALFRLHGPKSEVTT